MSQFRTVLIYSLKERVKSKSFLISTLLTCLIVVAAFIAPQIYSQYNKENTKQEKILVVDTIKMLSTGSNYLGKLLEEKSIKEKYDFTFENSLDRARVKEKIEAEKLNAVVYIENDSNFVSLKFFYENEGDLPDTMAIKNIFQRIYQISVAQKYNLSPDTLMEITKDISVEKVSVKGDTSNKLILSYFMILLLTMCILIYGINIAMSVVTEKSSRVMEVLITSGRPIWLLFGKTIGVGLAGLLQVSIIGAVAYVSYKIIGIMGMSNDSIQIDMSVFSVSSILLFGLFFILGYFLYAVIFAALGSLVSRVEDINSSTVPMTLLFALSILPSMETLMNPNGLVANVSTFIPFFSPIIIFIRIISSSIPVYQIILSVFLLAGSIAFFGWLSAKIYRIGVLLYGSTPSIRQVFKLLKQYNL